MHYTTSKETKAFVGYISEIPGVASEGNTLDELRENLTDALITMIKYNKAIFSKKIKDISDFQSTPLAVA